MSRIETKRPTYPTVEQIKRRRRAAKGLLGLTGLTVAFAASPGLRGATANALSLPAVSAEATPAKGQGLRINIGDNVKFTRAKDGKVVVDQIEYGADIAADASAANPDVAYTPAIEMLESEAAKAAESGKPVVYEVPTDWGLENIHHSASG